MNNKNIDWRDIFKIGASELKIDLNDDEIRLFEIYYRELVEWNKRINITALKSPDDIIIKHFIDSLSVLTFLPLQGKIVDIGSGGGFPGIPLKIMNPKLNTVLIEKNRKKSNFLKHIVRILGLKDIEVINERVEKYGEKGSFDYAISRAFGSIEILCEYALPLLTHDGKIVLMKGKASEKELTAINMLTKEVKLIEDFSFELPGKKGKRRIIVLQKCFT